MEGKGLFFFFFFFISRCRWERSHVICPSAPSRSSRFVRVGARPSLVLVLGSRNLEKEIKKRWYTTKNINASYFVSILRKKEDKKKNRKTRKKKQLEILAAASVPSTPCRVFFSRNVFTLANLSPLLGWKERYGVVKLDTACQFILFQDKTSQFQFCFKL